MASIAYVGRNLKPMRREVSGETKYYSRINHFVRLALVGWATAQHGARRRRAAAAWHAAITQAVRAPGCARNQLPRNPTIGSAAFARCAIRHRQPGDPLFTVAHLLVAQRCQRRIMTYAQATVLDIT